MHVTHFWHKLNLHWCKIITTLVVLLALTVDILAQNSKTINLTSYDESKIHFGFLLGGHASKYRIDHDDQFVDSQFDTLHSILPNNLGGFKVGFVVNFHLFQYLDFRILPTAGFYQNSLTYRFTNSTQIVELRDPTYVELPLLFKYKSVRRGNTRMYLVGGINPSMQAVGTKEKDDVTEKLKIKRFNLAFEFGVGLDMYQPFFKFSPEIRYSYGLINVLDGEKNAFSEGLKKITLHNISFFMTFEGGPTEFAAKKGKGKNKRRR